MDIELEGMRAFVAVAELLHFGRAAERLHMTQPALSRRIRRIEDALGARLLHRTTRRVDLTDAGRAFVVDARGVLEKAEAAVHRARAVDRGETGRLAIAAVTPAMDGFLAGVVRSFRARHPRIAVTIAEMDTASQLDALRDGRLHLGFVRLADHDVRGLKTSIVVKEPYVLALPRGHRLAATPVVALRSLAPEAFVALAPDVQPEIHRRLVAACVAAGFEPRIAQTARTIHAVTALVAAGLGVALVPESVRKLGRAGVSWRRVRGRLPTVEISAAWRAWNTSPALARFREVLDESTP
jgi:DNA-binding transcriptional LysR family regulator